MIMICRQQNERVGIIINENSYKYHVLYYDAITGDYIGKVKFHVGKTVI